MIEIDKYQSEIDNGQIVIYAVKGKTKYLMPDAYKDMYDNYHLAIEERTMSQPELFDIKAPKHYIPIYTGEPKSKSIKE